MSAGREKDRMIADLKQQVAAMEAQINQYKIKEQEHETMRRKLHNTIQELKVSASLSVYRQTQGLSKLISQAYQFIVKLKVPASLSVYR